MELTTGENDSGRRLDRILRKALKGHPLSLIHRLLRKGQVFVNGKRAKPQDRVESGVIISIPSLKSPVSNKPELSEKNNKPLSDAEYLVKNPSFSRAAPWNPKLKNTPNNSSMTPIWQDSGLIAFNKPAGLAVHGSDSLDTIVRSFLADKLPPSLSFTPGPLHRLDKPSSGIVVFSTSLEGAQFFTSLMKNHKIKKTYLAIVEGTINKNEIWEDNLIRDHEKKKSFIYDSSYSACGDISRAKTALTKITPLSSNNGYTLIQAEIVTGRTHQIRAQAGAHGHPLLGDIKYNERLTVNREQRRKRNNYIANFYLHAWKLEFSDHKIEAPLPEAFKKKMIEFFGKEII